MEEIVQEEHRGWKSPGGTPWLKVSEAAAYTQCGPKLLYRAVSAGHLRAARVGGRRALRFRAEWLDQFLERNAPVVIEPARRGPACLSA
jgi:excisionase family DNA binding protein